MKKRQFKQISLFISVLLLASFAFSLCVFAAEKLFVGGMPFGVRMDSGEVSVIRLQPFLCGGVSVSPAEDAGLRPADVILSINGQTVTSAADVAADMIAASDTTVEVCVEREKQQKVLKVIPKISDETGKRQLGILLKDSSAGIGTVTYICPDGRSFAGLGHGICKSDGNLIPFTDGEICRVRLSGVNKGKSGIPGELRGNLIGEATGTLLANTAVGIFGISQQALSDDPVMFEVADRSEISTGDATILCTLPDAPRTEYTVEITQIDNESRLQTKNYILKITDKRLLSKTGGIVQGMSGSPILQNGKLIGAVTHVMVSDPTTGYGIYIGNMLDEMKNWIS